MFFPGSAPRNKTRRALGGEADSPEGRNLPAQPIHNQTHEATMSTIFTIKVPTPKVRKAPAPPCKVMRDRRNRRPKDARRKREAFDY